MPVLMTSLVPLFQIWREHSSPVVGHASLVTPPAVVHNATGDLAVVCGQSDLDHGIPAVPTLVFVPHDEANYADDSTEV